MLCFHTIPGSGGFLGVILKNIRGPADLKNLAPGELEQLSCEIRELMIDVISRKGGHLAASLGDRKSVV